MRLLLFVLFVFIVACNQQDNKKSTTDTTSRISRDSLVHKVTPAPVNDDSITLMSMSMSILKSCKEKDFITFSSFVHPIAGVRFSPYAFVDTSAHPRLSAQALIEVAKSKRKINWGVYDGSGEPIILSADEYFKKFVYDKEFIVAPQQSINRILGAGNSLNNLKEIYRDCDFTEFYFPGTDPRYGGMDWKTLRLVFKKEKDKTYLLAIIHDQWTI